MVTICFLLLSHLDCLTHFNLISFALHPAHTPITIRTPKSQKTQLYIPQNHRDLQSVMLLFCVVKFDIMVVCVVCVLVSLVSLGLVGRGEGVELRVFLCVGVVPVLDFVFVGFFHQIQFLLKVVKIWSKFQMLVRKQPHLNIFLTFFSFNSLAKGKPLSPLLKLSNWTYSLMHWLCVTRSKWIKSGYNREKLIQTWVILIHFVTNLYQICTKLDHFDQNCWKLLKTIRFGPLAQNLIIIYLSWLCFTKSSNWINWFVPAVIAFITTRWRSLFSQRN